MSKLSGLALGAVLLLYPFCVYFGLQHYGPRPVGFSLLTLFIARYFTLKGKMGFLKVNLLPAASAAGVCLCLLDILADSGDFLKFYPVMTNIFFFILFASSLREPPSVIERLARLQHPNLSPRGVRHTGQVTRAWCVFFLLNGAVALYTVFFSEMKAWMIYNGLLSYVIMGLLILLELPIRWHRMALDKKEGWEF